MSEIKSELEAILHMAARIQDMDMAGDTSAVMEHLEAYLRELERWQTEHKSALDQMREDLPETHETRVTLRSMLEELGKRHQAITEVAVSRMDQVGAEITGVNKRARALKKYVDNLPQRVSLTRGKKG